LRRLLFALALVLLWWVVPVGSTEPPPMFLSLEGSPSVGNPSAKVVVVEFSDYQ